jgi:hypothetical protein
MGLTLTLFALPAWAQTHLTPPKPLSGQSRTEADNYKRIRDLADAAVADQHRDYSTEIRLLKPWAERGNADAEFALGIMYSEGNGVTRDGTEATRWLSAAANQGYVSAQDVLGGMFREGILVPKNDKAALRWTMAAATQDDASAQFSLGAMYMAGIGVPENRLLAYIWFNIAGANGSAEGVKFRNRFEKIFTPEQIDTAQKMASRCVKSQYRSCGA